MGTPAVCISLCVNRVAYDNRVSSHFFHPPKGKSTLSLREGELPVLLSRGGGYVHLSFVFWHFLTKCTKLEHANIGVCTVANHYANNK